MIAKLTGLLDTIGLDEVVIDVGGVGYLVFCSSRTLKSFDKVGDPITVFVEMHVREDHIHLFGFIDQVERDWFRLLTTVQGVGAKVAIAILGTLSPDDLANAMIAEDKATLTRAPGVGPRLAVRLLAELREKTADLNAVSNAGPSKLSNGQPNAVSDAISALVNLGYGRSAAFAAVSKIAQNSSDATSVELLVKSALKELSA
ncbi:MAG: Holliday junction branch migration protein RuvA [Rhodospirillaceae bacterium]|nr:Holliday junction branch migration protein RuvA [Rhodospirillaceae bacterium]|tara:strand:+ start:3775 stop:4380 length:606 start_codon:yes stop_codon:yes gene_type:complete